MDDTEYRVTLESLRSVAQLSRALPLPEFVSLSDTRLSDMGDVREWDRTRRRLQTARDMADALSRFNVAAVEFRASWDVK